VVKWTSMHGGRSMLRKLNPKTATSASSSLEGLLVALRNLLGHRIQQALGRPPSDTSSPIQQLNAIDAHPLFARVAEALDANEKVIVLLALVPHLSPGFFESLVMENLPGGGELSVLGGVKGTSTRGFLPTGETAQLTLAGDDLEARQRVRQYFDEDRALARSALLWLEGVREGEPMLGGRLVLAPECVERLLLDRDAAPRFGSDFPARRISTEMTWEDLVLHGQTRQQVDDIGVWLQHRDALERDENLRRKLKPGYRALFYGPPGTGKTLTAGLLGRQHALDVYRIDLSQIVSKFIGETEKNLENVFRRAEGQRWVLFFDEADALFGKRTSVQSAHDRYANQEVSYLLQRVEDYPGLLILASNFKSNLDEAFLRRFHALVHFPMPNENERLALWRRSMPAGLASGADVDLLTLARQYELSGASILNAVQFAALQAHARSATALSQDDLLGGIRKEYLKEEKSLQG
jgi:AAA+ superfamily predicted ATPase